MSKVRDRKKEAYWRRQFVEHGSSGKSVAEFCRRRRISPHQFHWWKRRLSLLDEQEEGSQAENEKQKSCQDRPQSQWWSTPESVHRYCLAGLARVVQCIIGKLACAIQEKPAIVHEAGWYKGTREVLNLTPIDR